jgi:hypothetical protein
MYHPTRGREEHAATRMLALLGQVADQEAALRHFAAAMSSRQAHLLRILLDAAAGGSGADEPGAGGEPGADDG